MHKPRKKLPGQRQRSRWQNWLLSRSYTAAEKAYVGQMTPLYLPEYDLWAVDLPLKQQWRQEAKEKHPKIKRGHWCVNAEVGPIWSIMSDFTLTGLLYNYRKLSTLDSSQEVVSDMPGFNGILEAFAADPAHFSVAGFESQYAPQELDFLHKIAERYEALGAREKSRSVAASLPPLGGTSVLSCTNAQAAYSQIDPLQHRHEPAFAALWQAVIANAAAYVSAHSQALAESKASSSETKSLNAFIDALRAVASALPPKSGEEVWLPILDGPDNKPQRWADFAGYLLLFETQAQS